jgi:hypothetical protein
MTQGETLFYLREIHSHWCTSNVSPEKLAELEAAKLIERGAQPMPVVRLTAEGARWKTSGRPRGTGSGIDLTGKRQQFVKRRPKKVVTAAKRLA